MVEFPEKEKDDHYNRMVSFIEPLAFLQVKAEQYQFVELAESLQKCVDEVYTMLKPESYTN